MDLKDPKIQKIALGLVAFFIVVYFWYSRLYSRYDNQIDLKSQEFETITTNLRNVEMKAKSLESLKLEYGDLVERYHKIESLLPEVKQIPSFLVQLHMASSLTGTRITKVIPLEIEADEFYNVASFSLQMKGTYHDFGTFISYVANFPFITNVSDMEIVAAQIAIGPAEKEKRSKLKKVGKAETMTANFHLSTYFVKEGERLSELVF